MKIRCRRIQDAAASGQPLNDLQHTHLASCARCAAVVHELQRLDQGLASLRQQVTEGLVDATVRCATAAAERAKPRVPRARRVSFRLGDRMVAAGIAVGLALVTLPFIGYQVFQLASMRGPATRDQLTVKVVPEKPAPDLNRGLPGGALRSETEVGRGAQAESEIAAVGDESVGQSYYREPAKHDADDAYDLDGKEAIGAKRKRKNVADGRSGSRDLGMGNVRNQQAPSVSATEPLARVTPAAPSPSSEEASVLHRQDKKTAERGEPRFGLHAQLEEEVRSLEIPVDVETKQRAASPKPSPIMAPPSSQPIPGPKDRLLAEGFVVDEAGRATKGDAARKVRPRPDRSSELAMREADNEVLRRLETGLAGARGRFADLPGEPQAEAEPEVGGFVGGDLLEKGEDAPSSALGLPDVLQHFGYGVLGYEPEEWKHVTLDRPVYFENTYLGGNAKLALLDHLAGTFQLAAGEVAPHRLARLLPQHLDPPAEGGMALHVDLDRATVVRGEPRRVFLQIGLVGGDNPAWRRPPLSLAALVIASDPGALKRARAALGELRSGLDRQDAFALVQPGRPLVFRPTGEADEPDRLATAPPAFQEGEVTRTLRGLREAFAGVEGRGSVRNRRLVILTDRELAAPVEREVHRLSLRDVATSVISLDQGRFTSHARVAIAGLGNLHVARSVDEARRVAGEDLASLTRIVARTLRLNIQPATGVKLIQVLGSRPLTRVEKQRVKEAELAVDRHVEATTGIASDRGEDDPGLQTVIPYFYGGDEHVVIVELEVSGPGPVADVSLKYKDLVDMKNRTLRVSGALSRQVAGATARQEQVRRNLFAFAMARVFSRLESGLRSGGVDAFDGLDDLRALIAQVRFGAEGSEADLRMLEQYAQLLARRPQTGDLASSLQYARLAKLGRSR